VLPIDRVWSVGLDLVVIAPCVAGVREGGMIFSMVVV
jgi:hypothetical protein